MFEALNATARAFFRGNKQDRRYAVAGAPVEGDVSLPQRREYVARTSLFALKPRCLVEKVRAPFGPLKQCTRSRVGHAAVSASGAIPCSQTNVCGVTNQHDIRINLRRIDPFGFIRLGWHL